MGLEISDVDDGGEADEDDVNYVWKEYKETGT